MQRAFLDNNEYKTTYHNLSHHSPGLAVGVGLFTTFLYVNKNIQTQVFLQVNQEQESHSFMIHQIFAVRFLNHVFACVHPQDHHSKLQCVWLLLFLISSTLLLYYTFLTETLYHW